MSKLLRIATVPVSLHILLKGQFTYMQQNGFEVFLASSEGKEIELIEKETGIKVNTLPLKRNISILNDLKALWATYILIRNIKPDIVHTLTPKAGLIGMVASCLARVPIRIHTFTGLIFPSKKGIFQKLLIKMDQLLCLCATHINPEGQGVKNDLISYKITSKPLNIIANGNVNGIDISHFNKNQFSNEAIQTLKQQFNIQPNDFVFCFIGRLVGDKGINELVTAFQNLSIKTPLSLGDGLRVRLLLVGTEEPELDPLLPETQKIIKENPHIIIAGWQDDVRLYLAISDVFVFPSYREGMPNVVLQAGAMGLPQIVTDINGSNEIIIHKKNGLIIPKKNTDALQSAMLELIKNPDLKTKLAQNARKMIVERFDQKMVWEALLHEYQQILAQKK